MSERGDGENLNMIQNFRPRMGGESAVKVKYHENQSDVIEGPPNFDRDT